MPLRESLGRQVATDDNYGREHNGRKLRLAVNELVHQQRENELNSNRRRELGQTVIEVIEEGLFLNGVLDCLLLQEVQ